MNRYLYFAVFVFLISGCKVLSKQESKSVQALAKAMTTSSNLPSEYTKQYYDIALESNQLLASIITKPSDKLTTLQGLIQDRLEADKIVKGYSAGYGVLGKYAELLLALTDDPAYQKELTKQKDAFIPSLDTLVSKYNTFNPANKIPMTSLGGLLSNIIQEVDSRRIKYLQRKYLKDLVSTADTIVAQICDQYKSMDFYKNDKQLASLSKDLDERYKIFMNYINLDINSANPYKYYKQYDPIYMDWKNKEVLLKELNQKNLRAITNIKTSHHTLKELLNKNASIKELSKNLQGLYASINTLKESYQKFSKDLTHSN